MTRITPPFQFLDLPKEIRFIVYENLDVSRIESTFDILSNTDGDCRKQPSIVLTTHALPIQILSTCRLIHHEAQFFFAPKLSTLRSHIPQIHLDAEFLDNESYDAIAHLLDMVLTSLNRFQRAQSPEYIETHPQKHDPTYMDEKLRKWILQTATLLAFQAHSSTRPLLDFCADPSLGYARICLDVPKRWYPLSMHPPVMCMSSSAKLAELMNETLDSARKRGLGSIQSAAIIYAQEGKSGARSERHICAIDYRIKREK